MGYDEWKKTKIEAYIWCCGDEVCNCHQPVIEEITPNFDAGYPWIRRRRLWEGTFRSDPDSEEYQDLQTELEKAKIIHKIVIESNNGL